MILVLNGHEMQLDSSAISQTFQVNDLAELKDRQAGHSNNIKVPRTPHNERVLEMLGVHADSRLHTKKLHAKIISNGIEVVPNGYAIIKGTGKYYDVVVYDGISSLNDELGDKTLARLDYADINHTLSIPQLKKGIGKNSGAVNAIADYGRGFTLEHLPASVYVHTLWDKIFKAAGFDYSGAVFQSEDFRSLVVPIVKGYDVTNSNVQIEDIDTATSEYVHTQIERKYNEFVKVRKPYVFPNGNFSASTEGVYQFDISISGLKNLGINEDGFTVFHTNVILFVNGATKAVYYGNEVNLSAVLFLEAGDVVSFVLEAGAFPKLNDVPYSHADEGVFSVSSRISLSIKKQSGGLFLDYSNLLPEITQKAFLKEIMQHFGLLMRPSKFDKKHYEFIEIERLLNDRDRAEDWSGKYISHSENYTIGAYGRKNMFQYTYPDELEDKNFASGVLEVKNEVAKKDRRVITSAFTAIMPSSVINGIDVYNVPLWEFEDGKLKTKESTPYLFSVKRHEGAINIKQLGVENTTEIKGDIPYLDFSKCYYQNYVDNYYRAFGNLLEKGKKIKATMRLNAIDIYNLDFFRLKYIEQLGAYFYLNKVSGFKGKDTVTVELIEVGDEVFNAPPEIVGNLEKSLKQKSVYVFKWSDFTSSLSEYYDREGDAPIAVKFVEISAKVVLKLSGTVVTSNTEISKESVIAGQFSVEAPASEIDFTEDLHFKIKDSGSGNYSTNMGRLRIKVQGRENVPPAVVATADKINNMMTGGSVTVALKGVVSDDAGVVVTKWSDKTPTNSNVIANTDMLNTDVVISNKGTHTFRLTATDSDGASAYDEVTVKCYERYTGIESEGLGVPNWHKITVKGEPNATVVIAITTDEYVSTRINSNEVVPANSKKHLNVILDEKGEYYFNATFYIDVKEVGIVYFQISEITNGMLGKSGLRLFAFGKDSGFASTDYVQ